MKKMALTILISAVYISVLAQESIRAKGYYNIVDGIYKTKSLAEDLTGATPNIIKPQRQFNSNDDNNRIALLYLKDKEIALFDQINDIRTRKSVGILSQTSFIQVDTIFYKNIFRNPAEKWKLTFNVWYAININGQTYYTDYKIHDTIAFRKKLDNYNQEFLLICQSTGYEEFYNNGYPNHFFVVILNQNGEVVYDSEILNFNFDDEFWDPSYVAVNMTHRGFNFKITNGLDSTFTGIWTGKELIKQ